MDKKEHVIEVGMFYYAKDRAFSEQLLPNKQVSGVVGYVDETGQHGLIVTLHQKYQTWADPSYRRPIPDLEYPGIGGWMLTHLYLDYLKELEDRHPCDYRGLVKSQITLFYCLQYNRDGIRAGEAFVPSIEEWLMIVENIDKINASLFLIDGADLLHDDCYWTTQRGGVSSTLAYVLPLVLF